MNAKSDVESPQFPTWLPAGAIAFYRDHARKEKRHALQHDTVEMLFRLCTFESMRPLWGKLNAHDADEGKVIKHGDLFSHVAARGYCGPIGEQTLTPKRREKWLKEIVETSTKLANLIRGSEFDRYLWDRRQAEQMNYLINGAVLLAQAKIELPGAVKVMIDNLSEHDRFSVVLAEFASRIPTLALPPIERPNAPEARRTYFVRELTGYFLEFFGKPHRRLVAIATAAAFNDDAITERQVTRLAPVPDTKKRKSRI